MTIAAGGGPPGPTTGGAAGLVSTKPPWMLTGTSRSAAAAQNSSSSGGRGAGDPLGQASRRTPRRLSSLAHRFSSATASLIPVVGILPRPTRPSASTLEYSEIHSLYAR